MTLIKWKNDRINTPGLFNDFFEDFFNRDLPTVFRPVVNTSMPAVNVVESKDGYRLEMALPGWSKDHVKINLDGNLLEISGEHESRTNDENEQYTRREFSRSSFNRTFTLPETVNAEAIDADFRDGVLMINIPMREEARRKGPKTIQIGSQSERREVGTGKQNGQSAPQTSQPTQTTSKK